MNHLSFGRPSGVQLPAHYFYKAIRRLPPIVELQDKLHPEEPLPPQDCPLVLSLVEYLMDKRREPQARREITTAPTAGSVSLSSVT